ncbi:MAG: diguanylate cyclase [Sulfuricurvum sp.]|nr:diguanylate cyclase [Sulfuricurvum sp.]MDD5386107.1 diguanylate cyclase [Sulfuricurvum sp.]
MIKNNLKTKILLTLSSVIFGVAMIVTMYNIIHDKEQNDIRMKEAYESVRLNYEETIHETVRFYAARANANMQSPDVLNAFISRDHDKLYALILPRWKVMQAENPSLSVMQFHNADGTSLLRMHQPAVYGDLIAAKRGMVAYIHKYHQTIFGFEEGRQGLAFRVLVPIVNGNVYVGAVEFGISAPFLTEKIYRYTAYNSFFLVRQDFLGTFAHIDRYFQIGEYKAIDVSPKLLPLLREYKSKHSVLENSILDHQHKTFAMTAVPVLNYLNQPMGAVMFIREVPDFWSHVMQMILAAALIALTLMITLGLIVARVYDEMTKKMNFQEMYNQTILDAIPSPIIVTDGDQLVAANQTFLEYLHYTSIEEFKRNHVCVCEYFEEGDTEDFLMPTLNDQRWTEYIIDHPLIHHKAKITMEGKTTIFDVKLSVFRFKEESRYVVIFTDISSIQSISVTDVLTGVANRLHFTMVYEHIINVTRREEYSLGIIFFDIDHFKQINDDYGHLTGDKILKYIAALVKQKIRKSDIVARWGGEEFVVLLPNTSLEETVLLAENLRSAIEQEHFEVVDKITCSFGVAALGENESGEALLKRADDLMYEAKERGRNRVIHALSNPL